MAAGPGGISDMARGFGYSIYLMLGLVFGIIGIIVFVVARTIVREEKARRDREGKQQPT